MRGRQSAGSSITVLAYHRVEPPGDTGLPPDLLEATPEQFEAQMRYIAARYNVVSPFDLARALRDGYKLPPRALAITFDDGYRSFKETAMPVLRRLGLPVGLFVVTSHADTPNKPFWWDELYRALILHAAGCSRVQGLEEIPLGTPPQREQAYQRLVSTVERLEWAKGRALVDSVVSASGVEPSGERFTLGWEELQALSEEGVAIGPHTRSHPILSRVTAEQLQSEIAGSWQDLLARVPAAFRSSATPTASPTRSPGRPRRRFGRRGCPAVSLWWRDSMSSAAPIRSCSTEWAWSRANPFAGWRSS